MGGGVAQSGVGACSGGECSQILLMKNISEAEKEGTV